MARRLQIQKRSPAPTFHPFKRLPFELRSKIWLLYDLPGPRIIEISFLSLASSITSPKGIYKVVSRTKAPRLAFVSQESRAEIKRIYKTLDLGPDFHLPFDIWVDFKIDTLHLSSIGQVACFNPSKAFPPINLTQSPQLSQLRNLAIGPSVYSHLQFPTFLSTHCPNLKTLIIPFQKTTLHDIKPASEYETLTFMDDSEYFAVGNAYTQSVFAADWRLRNYAGLDWLRAIETVMKDFWREGETNEERVGSVGVVKSEKMVEGTWMGGDHGKVVDYEVEIGGREVGLKFVVALYPREKKFEGLKSRLGRNVMSVTGEMAG